MTEDQLKEVVPRVLCGVRGFSKDRAIATEIGRLRTHAKDRSIYNIIESELELQAVSLVFDYEESQGEAITDKVVALGEELIKVGLTYLPKGLKSKLHELRWRRQIAWVLMAYALWLHRRNDLDRMSTALDVAKEIIDKHLISSAKPFTGTLCRYAYYRGLQHRDQNDLESATEYFQESFQKAQERRNAVVSLRTNDTPTLKIVDEETFSRCCMARVQAYGFGEIAFLRGDLAGAQAWFHTALAGLGNDGLERWRLSIRVYLEGSAILMSPFSSTGMTQVEQATDELKRLAESLEPQHKAYAELARTFRALGLLRLEQMRPDSDGHVSTSITVTLPQGLIDEVTELCPSKSFEDTHNSRIPVRRHGAMSSLISVICSELFMRGGRGSDCRIEIKWIRKQFPLSIFVQVEADLIEAQLMAAEEEWSHVIDLLERRSHDLHVRANRNQRALWYALASLASREAHKGRALSASIFAERAASINQRVRHGFVNHFVNVTVNQVTRQKPILFPMPYQAETPNFSLRENQDAAIENTLKAVRAFHPTMSSQAELIELLKYEKSTLYAKRHHPHIERWLNESTQRNDEPG